MRQTPHTITFTKPPLSFTNILKRATEKPQKCWEYACLSGKKSMKRLMRTPFNDLNFSAANIRSELLQANLPEPNSV